MADTDRFEAEEDFVEDEETEEEGLGLDDDLEDLDSFETLAEDEEVTATAAEETDVVAAPVEDPELEEEAEEELDEELEADLDDETEDVVEDEGEAALDVVLTRSRVGADDDDLGRLEEPRGDILTITAEPIGAQEFTCRSCFLVKNRAQLADEDEMICFDCA